MTAGRTVFVDTSFVLALLNRADDHHRRATAWFTHLRGRAALVTTEAVLIEVGNALAATNRTAAVQFADAAYQTNHLRVVSVDTPLLRRALRLYADRSDKAWGTTDCVSFIVMGETGTAEALTADHHFEQAGFVALLLHEPF